MGELEEVADLNEVAVRAQSCGVDGHVQSVQNERTGPATGNKSVKSRSMTIFPPGSGNQDTIMPSPLVSVVPNWILPSDVMAASLVRSTISP